MKKSILMSLILSLFVVFSCTEPEVINGKDGINGVDGKDGKNGKNGVDGKDGKDGKNGVDGKNGKDGVNGKDGKNGVDGKNGKDGVNGKDGKNGVDGKDGTNGKDGKNGENTGQGLTKIVLSGAITDAEAQTLINEKIGENTNTILILNTTNLTTVSFSNLPKVVDVKIENNSKLTNVSFGNLKSVYQNFTVKHNDVLTKIDLSVLEGVHSINLYKNNSLAEFSTPKLVGVYNSVRIQYTGIKHIDFSNAKSNLRSALYIRENHNLETIKLGFKNLGGYTYDESDSSSIYENPNLILIEAPNLIAVSKLTIEKNTLLNQILLPSLVTVGGKDTGLLGIYINNNITVLNLDKLEVGKLQFIERKLEKVTLPKLKEERSIDISSPVLKEVELSSLAKIKGRLGSNLTQASVDKLLANLASITPAIKNNAISISGASPSQAGLINLQKLRDNGNYVNVF